MPTSDDLKLARDGHLGFGPPEWTEEHRLNRMRPAPGTMLWQIEYDEDGLARRMHWMGRVPDEGTDETEGL